MDDDERVPGVDRENLAEIIELRSRLQPDLAANHETNAPPEVRKSAATDPQTESVSEAEENLREEAVRLLARKARSSGELSHQLLERQHDPNAVEALIGEFIENHYLDDRGLARITAESLRERKRASRTQIKMKLRERRFTDEVIDEVLAELNEEDESELLQTIADDRARRLVGLERQVAERRLLGYLARRGWSGQPAYSAAREAISRLGSEDSGGVRFR